MSPLTKNPSMRRADISRRHIRSAPGMPSINSTLAVSVGLLAALNTCAVQAVPVLRSNVFETGSVGSPTNSATPTSLSAAPTTFAPDNPTHTVDNVIQSEPQKSDEILLKEENARSPKASGSLLSGWPFDQITPGSPGSDLSPSKAVRQDQEHGDGQKAIDFIFASDETNTTVGPTGKEDADVATHNDTEPAAEPKASSRDQANPRRDVEVRLSEEGNDKATKMNNEGENVTIEARESVADKAPAMKDVLTLEEIRKMAPPRLLGAAQDRELIKPQIGKHHKFRRLLRRGVMNSLCPKQGLRVDQ